MPPTKPSPNAAPAKFARRDGECASIAFISSVIAVSPRLSAPVEIKLSDDIIPLKNPCGTLSPASKLYAPSVSKEDFMPGVVPAKIISPIS